MLTNRNLALIAVVLMIGATSDGVLYNRPQTRPAIYPLNEVQSIEIKYQNKVVLALGKATDEWAVISPFQAPTKASRVALLLDSNYQTARSYSKEDLQYARDNELAQRFADPVELRLDGKLFLLGEIEPVSQLRYVSANDSLYLQADHIVPLLQSPKSTFTDLNITNSARAVELENVDTAADPIATTLVSTEQLAHWSNLDALTVIDADLLQQPPMAAATIDQTAGEKRQFEIFRFQQHVALQPQDKNFAYLISEKQASQLGICVYC